MDYDVIIVGAGPGGASAAFFLGQRGQRVLVLERARLPRYKPCGGGVPKVTFRRFPFSFDPVVEAEPAATELHYPGQSPTKVSLDDRPIAMVRRSVFDAYILTQAANAKVEVLDDVAVTGVTEHPDGVEVTVADGRTFFARYLIGADGANSTVARALGLRKRRALGSTLEAMIEPDEATLARWAQTSMFQYGACPGGYLWIFPKRGRLSVGIGRFWPGKADRSAEPFGGAQDRRSRQSLRGILVREMANFGVDLTGVRLHGHPLPFYWRRELLHTTRCLLVGDAAGLADPLMGEGIRFAVYSAEMAAQAITRDDLAGYTRRVQRTIGNDHLWAKKVAWVLYGFPRLSWQWGIRNPRLIRALVDVLRERRSYRTFAQMLPLYVLDSLVRYPFVRRHG